MSTITAILDPDSDGTLHVPIPEELRGVKVRITATLQAAGIASTPTASAQQVARRTAALAELRQMGGLRSAIPDAVEWQRQMRQDRTVPGRD